ncbi:hypothetical protein BGZ73_000127 [Actinomortierella ambigua]|nr:hypothetical protein BGZ73_000127 [Actinomortierella ambigua]
MSSPPPSAGQGGQAYRPFHPHSQQHPQYIHRHSQSHSHDHDVVQPMHPHHAPTPIAFEVPVKATVSALSSPFMSISIANTKTAAVATTLTTAKSPTNTALNGTLVTPHKDPSHPPPFSKELPRTEKSDVEKHDNTEPIRERSIPAPSYESSLVNIPALDPLPPPPVYDIVNCSTSQTLLLVSSLINTILTVNDRLRCPKITLFHSRAIPNISIEAYLTRILQYAPFQNEVLLIILLYFDRIGGGCKPTQVLTNNIPKPLLLKAFGTDKNPFGSQSYDATLATSYIAENAATATPVIPKGDSRLMDELMKDGGAETDKESAKAAVLRQAKELEAKHQHFRRSKPPVPGSKLGTDSEMPEEEEPIEDEIYTSSAESPIGSKLIINSFNIHRLLITSILVACKFSSDVFYPNVRYAKVLNQESAPAPPPHTPSAIAVELQEKPVVESSVTSRPPLHEPAPIVRAPVPTRPAPLLGSYRDSKEGIRQEYVDDEDAVSQKGDDSLMSPTESEADMSVLKGTPSSAESTAAPQPYSRHRVMNLDSLVWPTNNVDDYRPSTNYFFGSMVKDEDAERIEQEFNRPSPPPESQEHQKRKLQRLSSGSMETTPSKRANPTNDKKSSKEGRLSSSSSTSSSGNILKPFLRKIASLTHRSGPQTEEQMEPEPLPLRTHPYLVRPRVSPPSPALPEPKNVDRSNGGTDATMWHAVSPTASSGQASSWARQRSDPPPYSGRTPQRAANSSEPSGSRSSSHSRSRVTRDYRRHRSREPSISTLASELTFEPKYPSVSPSVEDDSEVQPTTPHPATLAPLFFPSQPQTIDNICRPSHPRLLEDMDEEMPMAEREGTPPPTRQDHTNSTGPMQVDQAPRTIPRPKPGTDKTSALKFAPPAAAAIAIPATPAKSCSSSRRSSVSSSTTDAREPGSSTAGRQWNPSHHAPASSSTTSNSSPSPGVIAAVGGRPPRAPQVYHPHHSPYVASYYAPPNNLQLYHDPVTMKTFPIMSHPHQSVLVAMPPMPAVSMTPTVAPAHPSAAAAAAAAASATSSKARPSKTIRQFASIRPRTPTVIAAQTQAAQAANPPTSSGDDKSGPTAKSSKKSLFGGSKKAARPTPPPPACPPPAMPFMTAGTPMVAGAVPPYGAAPIMAFAHAPPPPPGMAHHQPGVIGGLGAPVTGTGAPILIPLIPVMYNNVRPIRPPPPPAAANPPPLVKIAPKLPQA